MRRAPTPLDYAAWRERRHGRITERLERELVLALAGSVTHRRVLARSELELVAGDASRLPFDEGTFDVVVAVTVLCFVSSPQEVVREIARVLKPGGRAIVGEPAA